MKAKLYRLYLNIYSLLFIAFDWFFPSKSYGRYMGLCKSFIALYITLVVNFLEKTISFLIYHTFFIEHNQDLSGAYSMLYLILMFAQFFIQLDEEKEFFKIGRKLQKAKKAKKLLYSFWLSLFGLIFFSIWHIKMTHGR